MRHAPFCTQLQGPVDVVPLPHSPCATPSRAPVRSGMSTARRWAPSVAWGTLILIATSLPGSTLPAGPQIPGIDKLVHASLYGVLAFLVGQAMSTHAMRALLMATLAIGIFAAADEWHQRWIPGRGADPMDWLADLAGATIGFLLSRTALARRETST